MFVEDNKLDLIKILEWFFQSNMLLSFLISKKQFCLHFLYESKTNKSESLLLKLKYSYSVYTVLFDTLKYFTWGLYTSIFSERLCCDLNFLCCQNWGFMAFILFNHSLSIVCPTGEGSQLLRSPSSQESPANVKTNRVLSWFPS